VAGLFTALRQAVLDLQHLRQRFALVGGLAVSARTTGRVTSDVDLVVAVSTDAEAERVVSDMRARGYSLELVLDHVEASRLSTVRMRSPADPDVHVDLLFASSGVESEIVADAESVVIVGVTVPVARAGHLLALKLLSMSERRARKDGPDLDELLRVADAAEIARAREAIRLIAERGYARGKDLAADLTAEVARHAQ
jgi:predicted nucleotidyltransferase